MSGIELQVFEIFKRRFSEEEAILIMEYIQYKFKESSQQKKVADPAEQGVSRAKANLN